MKQKKVIVLILTVFLFVTMFVFITSLAEVVPQEGRWVRLLTIEEIFCPWKYFKQEGII